MEDFAAVTALSRELAYKRVSACLGTYVKMPPKIVLDLNRQPHSAKEQDLGRQSRAVGLLRREAHLAGTEFPTAKQREALRVIVRSPTDPQTSGDS